MGWSIGYDENWKRDIGYGVPAICDHPGCTTKIHRGLSYVCGGEPYGGERGCGLYFCTQKHLSGIHQLCERCSSGPDVKPFEPKPDHPEWAWHKLTDPSWEEWRKGHTEELSVLRELVQVSVLKMKGHCALGVGCEEAGVCYASAMAQPERCGRIIYHSQEGKDIESNS